MVGQHRSDAVNIVVPDRLAGSTGRVDSLKGRVDWSKDRDAFGGVELICQTRDSGDGAQEGAQVWVRLQGCHQVLGIGLGGKRQNGDCREISHCKFWRTKYKM